MGSTSHADPNNGFFVTGDRSPIPRPGEIFEHPIPPKVLADEDSASIKLDQQSTPDEGVPVIPWGQARRYVNKTVTIHGRVVDSAEVGSVCFLNFARDWRGLFYIVVMEQETVPGALSTEAHFHGQTIRVTGTVRTYEGRPQIKVTTKSQIKILPP